jgi:hypothetical protein
MANVINPNFKSNFNFQDQFQKQIENILRDNAKHLMDIRLATKIEDTKQSTDMVMRIETGVTVAVRIRRPNCQHRDLTIRSRAYGGGETEIHKLQGGWGDWYVYAWSNPHGLIDEWMLVNIDKMRQHNLLTKPRKSIPNHDGTAFVNISLDELYNCGALTAAVMLRQKQYWHHIVNSDNGRVWEAYAYSILEPKVKVS